jgi:hypothetical protein
MLTRATRQIVLTFAAGLSLLLLVLFLRNGEVMHDPPRPAELQPLASWLANRPADWLAASAVTDHSLDAALPLPRRIALWRGSYALAHHLAPLRANPTAGFVRAGLFHWYELGPDDRQAVLHAAAPLLRDPVVFAAMYRPLWELTRDLGYLRRTAPHTIDALWMLRELALASGDFAQYRQLRAALSVARIETFRAKRETATVEELTAILPQTLTDAEEPVVTAILEEIDRRPFDVQRMGGRIEEIAVFAILHHLQPLSALQPYITLTGRMSNPTRARLAVALGDRAAAERLELLSGITTTPDWARYHLERAEFEEKQGEAALAAMHRSRASVAEGLQTDAWTNLCGRDELCTSASRQHDGSLSFTMDVSQSDEIPPYVEVYRDDVLVEEGEVRGQRTFSVAGAPGPHRIEVRLVNRYTRNGTQRRVRLS